MRASSPSGSTADNFCRVSLQKETFLLRDRRFLRTRITASSPGGTALCAVNSTSCLCRKAYKILRSGERVLHGGARRVLHPEKRREARHCRIPPLPRLRRTGKRSFDRLHCYELNFHFRNPHHTSGSECFITKRSGVASYCGATEEQCISRLR